MASASWGRSVLTSRRKASNLACCWRPLMPGGRVVSFFRSRRRIGLGRALHGGRLVGAFGVKLAQEGIEPGLLLEAIHAGRARGFLLQGEMHALVPAVLVRMTRLDALDGDAESEPPHRKAREVVEAVGTGEGEPVVAPDRHGQAALAEEL